MITNEREYRGTKAAIRQFEDALAHLSDRGGERDPILQQALHESIESQLASLHDELVAYEKLRAGEVTVVEIASFDDLPAALARARVAAGLSQEALAERVGMKAQQIQRYEKGQYRRASVGTVERVMRALGTWAPIMLYPRRASDRPVSDMTVGAEVNGGSVGIPVPRDVANGTKTR